MRAWLLTWNPKNWDWKASDREKLRIEGKYVEPWTCSSTQPEIGDRVFLMRTGDDFRGIIAAGHVAKTSYDAAHYDPKKAAQGEMAKHIDVDFDFIQDDLEDSLPVEDLTKAFPNQTWVPMASGIEINPQNVDLSTLENMWGKKIGPAQNLLNYLKSLPDIDPQKHDGSYELMQRTIEAYSRMTDRSMLDEKDFNVVLYNSVITLRNSVEVKKGHIANSHLPENEKQSLSDLLDSIWSKAMDYENSKIENTRIIGMFGIGYQTAKTDPDSSKKFIEMCISLLPVSSSKAAFAIVEKVVKGGLFGVQAASESQILHCLKPTIFPVVNGGNDGQADIYRVLNINLKQRSKGDHYIENARKIEAFRDQNLAIKNYRVIDLASRYLAVQIDFLGVLDYLEKYRNRPYEDPYKQGLSTERINELLDVKKAGQTAADELKKIADLCCEKNNLVKSGKPIKYLDGSNKKTTNYLWARLMNLPLNKSEPESISIFVDMNENTKKARYRVSLEVENEMVKADPKIMERHHSFLALPVNPLDNLTFMSGSNEDGSPNILTESQDKIIEGVTSKKFVKVQLCRIIDHTPSLTNEECSKGILDAVQKLLPFYQHILGGNVDPWFPTKAEYDPKLTKEDFKNILSDGTATDKQKQILTYMMALGGISSSKMLASAGFGNSPQLEISDLGERICNRHGVTPQGGENSKYWPAAFYGRLNAENLYDYKIREELQEALKEAGTAMSTKRQNKLSQNMILFGPPGTGKTYSTTSLALAICNMGVKSLSDIQAESYDIVRADFINLKDAGRVKFVTFHQSYDYEEFIEGIKPDLNSGELKYVLKPGIFRAFCEEAGKEENKGKNFVFVIDEINRGNISKIFGELITLIEPSKRTGEGQKEATTATLPYSGAEFGVPKNVYILGTMNTADRSIALLDTALRRRFDFIEMLPDPEVLAQVGANVLNDGKGNALDVAKMLSAMNARIVDLFDREHTIGHAFFTKLAKDATIDCLAHIFMTNVIPLLQEYFYEDYEKIRLVLGDNNKSNANLQFIRKIPVDPAKDFGGSIDFDIPEFRYEINEDALFDLQSYIQIAKLRKNEKSL